MRDPKAVPAVVPDPHSPEGVIPEYPSRAIFLPGPTSRFLAYFFLPPYFLLLFYFVSYEGEFRNGKKYAKLVYLLPISGNSGVQKRMALAEGDIPPPAGEMPPPAGEIPPPKKMN